MEKAILCPTAHVENCAERNVLMVLCVESLTHKLFHEEERLTPLQVAFVQDSSKTILPVISGFMKGKEGDLMETNVFYDSGTQVSNSKCMCRAVRARSQVYQDSNNQSGWS